LGFSGLCFQIAVVQTNTERRQIPLFMVKKEVIGWIRTNRRPFGSKI
jgi:hypothetical protein